MNSCEMYQEWISRLIDGELSAEEQAEVERHIASCPDCAAMYEAFRALSAAIGEDLEEPPARIHETVMSDVRRDALRRRQAPRRIRSFLAMAACAAVVLLAAVRLPRMGSAAPMLASNSSLQEAPAEAAVYDEEALYDSAEAEEEAPGLGASGALFAAAPAEEPAEERVEAPIPEPELSDAKAAEAPAEEAAVEETHASFLWYAAAALVLILSAVWLLRRGRHSSDPDK